MNAFASVPERLKATQDELRPKSLWHSWWVWRLRHPVFADDKYDRNVLEEAHGVLTTVEEVLRAGHSGASDPWRDVRTHMVDVADLLGSLVSVEARAPAAITIKLLWGLPGREPVVHTFIRNRNAAENRESYDPPNNFAWQDNSAFREIVQQRGGFRYWGENNLVLRQARGQYENKNPRWKSLYNSVAVMGIPPRDHAGILGFLCADSLLGRVDTPRVYRLLAIMSRHLYDVLGQCLELLDAPARESGADRCVSSSEVGWVLNEPGRLSAINPSHQSALQLAAARLEQAGIEQFIPPQATGAPRNWGSPALAPAGEQVVNEPRDFASLSVSDPISPRLAKIRASGGVTEEDFERILEKIAPQNEYANQLLGEARRRRAT